MEKDLFAQLSCILVGQDFTEELRQGPEYEKGQFLAFARVPRASAFQYWSRLKEALVGSGFYPFLAQDETALYEIVDAAWPLPTEAFDREAEFKLLANTLKQPAELVQAKYGHLLEKANIEKAALQPEAGFSEIVAAGCGLSLADWFACCARESDLPGLEGDLPAGGREKAGLEPACEALGSGLSAMGGGVVKKTLDLLKPDSASDACFDSGLASLGLTPDLLDLLAPGASSESSYEDPYLITSVSHKISENPVRITGKCVLCFLPVSAGYEVPALLRFGQENGCPPPVVQVAILKHWFEKHGAELAVLSHDGLELVLKHPPSGKELAQLAREQYLYCPQLLELLSAQSQNSASTASSSSVVDSASAGQLAENGQDDELRTLKLAALERNLELSLVWSFYWV